MTKIDKALLLVILVIVSVALAQVLLHLYSDYGLSESLRIITKDIQTNSAVYKTVIIYGNK